MLLAWRSGRQSAARHPRGLPPRSYAGVSLLSPRRRAIEAHGGHARALNLAKTTSLVRSCAGLLRVAPADGEAAPVVPYPRAGASTPAWGYIRYRNTSTTLFAPMNVSDGHKPRRPKTVDTVGSRCRRVGGKRLSFIGSLRSPNCRLSRRELCRDQIT